MVASITGNEINVYFSPIVKYSYCYNVCYLCQRRHALLVDFREVRHNSVGNVQYSGVGKKAGIRDLRFTTVIAR